MLTLLLLSGTPKWVNNWESRFRVGTTPGEKNTLGSLTLHFSQYSKLHQWFCYFRHNIITSGTKPVVVVLGRQLLQFLDPTAVILLLHRPISQLWDSSTVFLLLDRHYTHFRTNTAVIVLRERQFSHFWDPSAVIVLRERQFSHFWDPATVILVLHRHFSHFVPFQLIGFAFYK